MRETSTPALSDAIKACLTEGPITYIPPKHSRFSVDYYVTTPKGSNTRFSRTTTLAQIKGAESETAVLGYLRKLHPGTDIQIQSLTFS